MDEENDEISNDEEQTTPDAQEITGEEVSEAVEGQPAAEEQETDYSNLDAEIQERLQRERERAFREGEEQKQKEMVGALTALRAEVRELKKDKAEPEAEGIDEYLNSLDDEPAQQLQSEVEALKAELAELEALKNPPQEQPPQFNPSVESAYKNVIAPIHSSLDEATAAKLASDKLNLNGLAEAVGQIGLVVDATTHLKWIADNPERANQIANLPASEQVRLLSLAAKAPRKVARIANEATGSVSSGGSTGSAPSGSGWALP